MAEQQLWMLGESQLAFPDGGRLDGVSQGDGSHLQDKTIRLSGHDMTRIGYSDRDETFDDSDSSQKLTSAVSVDGVTYAQGTRIEAEYRLTLTDPETGDTWEAVGFNLNGPGGGAAYGTVEGLAFIGPSGSLPPTGVDLTVTATSEGPRDVPASGYVTPLCFAAGTCIATPRGSVPVERLGPGDLVLLASGDTAPVRLCLTRRVSAKDMAREPGQRPVRVVAGALGQGLPLRDLVLSRQHRLLAASPIVARMFGVPEVLIAAHRLAALPGIAVEARLRDLVEVHLVLDRHRIVLAEGAPAESFYPGPMALRSLSGAHRAQLARLFPDTLARGIAPTAARPIPPNAAQRRCVDRHLTEGIPVLDGLVHHAPHRLRTAGAPAT